MTSITGWIFVGAGLLPGAAFAGQVPVADQRETSLEELMNIEVTSASKKDQRLADTAASVFVITREMIRRSGLTSLPELLRLAPGVEVARTDGALWSIGIRGFSNPFGNKLLVLIDGRSVYNDTVSGVYWLAQDMPVDQIERIEVVRGPVAAIWGANAVNGVINIITRSPHDTAGGTVVVGAGGDMQGYGDASYSGRLGSKGDYRIFGGYRIHDALPSAFGNSEGNWIHRTGGFRLQWELSDSDSLAVEAQGFTGNSRNVLDFYSPYRYTPGALERIPMFYSGGSVVGEWRHTYSERSSLLVRAYYDRYDETEVDVNKGLDVVDVEMEHHWVLSPRQELVWGAGYRRSAHSPVEGLPLTFDPIQTNLFSIFGEDQISLIPEKLYFIAGTAIQHNSFTGVEIQPTGRLLWRMTPRHSLWTAVSRAVRTPSVLERGGVNTFLDYDIHMGQVFPLVAHGNPNLQSETLIGYEMGERSEWTKRLSLDWSAFYNLYQRLSTIYTTNLYIDPRGFVVMPTVYANQGSARTYGADASVNFTATRRWKLSASYSWLKMVPGAYTYPLSLTQIWGPTDPQHQSQFHSYLDLSRTVELDTAAYYTASIPALSIPAYWRADVRLGWRPTRSLEFSLAGQNLLRPEHSEFLYDVLGRRVPVPRGIAGNVTWSFGR